MLGIGSAIERGLMTAATLWVFLKDGCWTEFEMGFLMVSSRASMYLESSKGSGKD